MVTAACRRPISSNLLTLELRPHTIQQPIVFNLAFIERRMRQHKELQQRMAEELAVGIIREVQSAIMQKVERAIDEAL